jgi:imidazolonepropionase-like amidohydrolase
MRGFTTVRDVGGPAFGLKRAIDEGIVPGPRIYPSGAIITVTSGHGDFRQPSEVPRVLGAPQSRGEQTGAAMIADSPDEVRVRVREQLLQGATQIKLTAGGGVASPHSPLDCRPSPKPNYAPLLKLPRTGELTLLCTHTHQFRSNGRSPLA